MPIQYDEYGNMIRKPKTRESMSEKAEESIAFEKPKKEKTKGEKIEECLDQVGRSVKSGTINTTQDLKDRLNGCAEGLNKEEIPDYQPKFAQVFEEKQAEMKERHETKGQTYGESVPHKKSGQRAIYASQRRRSE